MRQAVHDLRSDGTQLPAEVNPDWLTLGNVRTDIASLEMDRKYPLARIAWGAGHSVVTSVTSAHLPENVAHFPHYRHAMRSRGQPLAESHILMCNYVRDCMHKGLQEGLSWQQRALAFGSALHTLQDSYCTAHAARINNGEPTSPIIDMFCYPSRQHPITTRRDGIWADKQKTAFKPEAAAAITSTVAALRIFIRQAPEEIEPFIARYLPFRGDIRASRP